VLFEGTAGRLAGGTAQHLQAVSLHCDADLLSDEVLAVAKAKDIPVLCYTVNAPELAKSLFARGVSALFTDRLDHEKRRNPPEIPQVL
jgi:glycerophosphoryl diester phosphodiesterase